MFDQVRLRFTKLVGQAWRPPINGDLKNLNISRYFQRPLALRTTVPIQLLDHGPGAC